MIETLTLLFGIAVFLIGGISLKWLIIFWFIESEIKDVIKTAINETKKTNEKYTTSRP